MSRIWLAIETSNPGSTPGGGAVAIVREQSGGGDDGERPGVEVEMLDPVSRHDDALVPAIDRVCRCAGVGARDIDRVCVSIGPGGYTALRIAVTAAKMIGEAAGATVHAVPTAEALRLRVPEDVRAGRPVAVLLAWKREDVWVRVFDSAEEACGGRIVGLDDVREFAGQVVVGDEALRRSLLERGVFGEGVVGDDVCWVVPAFDPVAVYEAARGIEPIDPAELVPLYPREPEAVRKWKMRGR